MVIWPFPRLSMTCNLRWFRPIAWLNFTTACKRGFGNTLGKHKDLAQTDEQYYNRNSTENTRQNDEYWVDISLFFHVRQCSFATDRGRCCNGSSFDTNRGPRGGWSSFSCDTDRWRWCHS